ncbi:MAG: glycogen/starch/alpha-glucan phosphorylase [Clostridium sp.]
MVKSQNIERKINDVLNMFYGTDLKSASVIEVYNAVSKAVLGEKYEDRRRSDEVYFKGKMTYYFSIEFLMGRALGNNLINLALNDEVKKVLGDVGLRLEDIEEVELDAAFGNGGLGRLAACFLDSAATQNMPIMGYGIKYEEGLFKQEFRKGFQVEEGDNWNSVGEPWQIKVEKDQVEVKFSDLTVKAVPYDMYIMGYGTRNVNVLRLWESKALKEFDFNMFNEGCFDESMKGKVKSEHISRVLYPNDSREEGRILRIEQEYFFVSASLKDIIKRYIQYHGQDLKGFSKYVAIQLNDTHPVVAIPELIRILVDEHNMDMDEAISIAKETFAYTNHTIMAEALEKWECYLYGKLLPRVYQIIEVLNNRLVMELREKEVPEADINVMRIIQNGIIHMASLALYGSHAVNGVAKLHTKILMEDTLHPWYLAYPAKFQNKTNGISPRRWLKLCNEELAELITSRLHSENWLRDLSLLSKLKPALIEEDFIRSFLAIKDKKKEDLAEYIYENEGVTINPKSMFIVQVKRIHEYKRQLLNALLVLDIYFKLKANPKDEITPMTFIFGGKAAPGYFRAKGIIKFINDIANLINGDEEVKGKLSLVFVKNYNVSYGERLFPAADLSVQISTAGKEASGTGNMKFMINGTPTVGTFDGANIEIVEEAGAKNNFIFGARVEELRSIDNTYNPQYYYYNVEGLKRVIDTLIDGTFNDENTGMYREIYNSLLYGCDWQRADVYFVLKDFEDYRRVINESRSIYEDKLKWGTMCVSNLIASSKFSSDRTVLEYARDIWKIKPKVV